MSKKVKIALATGVQLLMIGAIGDFVHWPYMKYVFIAGGIALGLTLLFFIWDMSQE